MPDGIKPFAISVDTAALDELRDRLRRARWPEREPVGDWSQGVPLGYLQGLCGYRAEGYDWRATEARLEVSRRIDLRGSLRGQVAFFAFMHRPRL